MVEVLSNSVSKQGFFKVPVNLDFNATNNTFETLTLGQMRNHFNEMIENTSDLVDGETHSLRDFDIRHHSGNILQQSSPLTLAGYFMRSNQYNIWGALEFNSREYQKYKNQL